MEIIYINEALLEIIEDECSFYQEESDGFMNPELLILMEEDQ